MDVKYGGSIRNSGSSATMDRSCLDRLLEKVETIVSHWNASMQGKQGLQKLHLPTFRNDTQLVLCVNVSVFELADELIRDVLLIQPASFEDLPCHLLGWSMRQTLLTSL